jgi:hypothetical protein
MPHKPLQKEELIGSSEITFSDRQEDNYPQLMRLSMDFEIHVLRLQRNVFSRISRQLLPVKPLFVLTDHTYRSQTSYNSYNTRNTYNNSCATYSPRCNSLGELEAYACAHHVDILHSHLFGNLTIENSF